MRHNWWFVLFLFLHFNSAIFEALPGWVPVPLFPPPPPTPPAPAPRINWHFPLFAKINIFDFLCFLLAKIAFVPVSFIFIPRHTIVAEYYGFTLDTRVSIHPSVRFLFPDDNWVNINGFSQNLVYALMLWISGLGLLMGKFCQIFMDLSARDTPIFSFLDDNLSK